MSEDSQKRRPQHLRGRVASEYLEPEKVPDWNTLPYPDLDTVKTYRSHPKPYTWPQYHPIHTFDRDCRYTRPDIYLEARTLLRPVDVSSPRRDRLIRVLIMTIYTGGSKTSSSG